MPDEINYTGHPIAPPELEPGAVMTLQTFFLPPDQQEPLSLVNLHSGNGAILAMAVQIGGDLKILGSAIMVSPGVAVTADHVMSEIKDTPGACGAFAVSMRPDATITFWNIVGGTQALGSVVTVICVRPMSEHEHFRTLWLPVVDRAVPVIDEPVTILGFRETRAAAADMLAQLALYASVGRISAVYPGGRDRLMMPGPCAEVSARIKGGMSGGPVFDGHGRLIGVASSAIEGNEKQPVGFISLIDPATRVKFRPVWPPKWYPEELSLIECKLGVEFHQPPLFFDRPASSFLDFSVQTLRAEGSS